MNFLNENYEQTLSKINFLERKKKILFNKTIIVGAPKVGKTYLIFDLLSNFKKQEILYIDFLDIKNRNFKLELKPLQDFINQNEIKVLVLENVSFESLEKISVENIIISATKDINIDGFSKIFLNNLDFEEYLLFDNKQLNITSSFNTFLKYGNSPEILFIEESKKESRIQEIINLNLQDNTDLNIYLLLLENIDEKKSIFQLFNTLKMRIKISKDRFYERCKIFEEQRLIFFLDKFEQKNSLKKIYCYNHAFPSAINFQKKFKQEFTNMVFLELKNSYEEIYYLDYIDFYIPQIRTAVVCIPFFNEVSNATLLKKITKTSIELNISNIEIITVSNSNKIKNNQLKIEVFSFFEWALR